MINLIDQLTVYEINLREIEGEFCDGDYILSPSWMDPEQVIEEWLLHSRCSIANRKIEVYEARSATVTYDRGLVDLQDVDCCTGGNGSPILEVYYDENEQEYDPYDI